MTDYKFGDVVLVPFPFSDQTTTKKRPAAVISSDQYNRKRPDILILAITSQIREPPAFGECAIADWNGAGLLKPSVAKPVIATIEVSIVLRQLGRLQAADLTAIRKVLDQILGSVSHS